MERDFKTRTLSIAALGLGAGLSLASAALAAPPQGRLLALQSRAQVQAQAPAQRLGSAQTLEPAQRLESEQSLESVQHLDLRLPSHAMEMGSAEEKSGAFPSMARRQNSAQGAIELPTLGSEGLHARPSVQEFVRKVHREGLPLARLYETNSALVHLGLSPRGKPGLWLVQKTR